MNYRQTLYTHYSQALGNITSPGRSLLPQIFTRVYPPLPSDGSTLIADVGCGRGEWLAWAASHGCRNLVGIDASGGELELAESIPGVQFVQEDAIVALKRYAGEFGLIHAKDLFEHLNKNEAVEFLRACHEALKPNGELWVYTFNAQGWFAGATYHGDFTHELAVTPASLTQVLRATGFTVISVDGRLPTPRTLGGLGRRLLFRVLAIIGRSIISARHGRRVSDGITDWDTTLPDLLARAKREIG